MPPPAPARRRPHLPLALLPPRPLLLLLLLLLLQPDGGAAWRHYKSWSDRNWCEQVIDPLWPYSYSKTPLEDAAALAASLGAAAAAGDAGSAVLVGSEAKGRTASNFQDMGHECTVGGAHSRCSLCEDFACGEKFDATCAFQVQGITWSTLPRLDAARSFINDARLL